ncbi:hypothetical protein vseg_009116 [Gypsophila vaccaria]
MVIEEKCSNGFSNNNGSSSGGGDSGSLRTYKRRKCLLKSTSIFLATLPHLPLPSSSSSSSPSSLDKKAVNHHNSNGVTTTAAAQQLSSLKANGSSNGSAHSNVSRLCERALSKLFMSGKFTLLCRLLSENFHGLKIDKLLDFSLINSRMKDGAYERTPMLFSSDIQQLWGSLNSIGKEMVSLSNDLSELSKGLCHELVPASDCKLQIKQEDIDASVFCTCRQCGERSDERDCLVCDSCEAMFHVSCIEPAVKEIPHKSWYCASCTSCGVGSLHEDCVVCDRLKANSGVHGGVDTDPMCEETLDDEESLDGIIETGPQVFKGTKHLPCKVCGTNLQDGEEFQVCEHRFCQFKYYHIRCLSSKELKSYGPRWYCPSCLCRVCLTDKDDDDIVMCDGCDHGYHIYCMNPPRTSIPRGKWFCLKCDAGIKAIRKAKKLVEDLERRNKANEGDKCPDLVDSLEKAKLDFVDAVSGSGGMDMLLTAARTLNGEEDNDKC